MIFFEETLTKNQRFFYGLALKTYQAICRSAKSLNKPSTRISSS